MQRSGATTLGAVPASVSPLVNRNIIVFAECLFCAKCFEYVIKSFSPLNKPMKVATLWLPCYRGATTAQGG